MKPRPVIGFHVCALELQSIFKKAAKFILRLSLLPVNQQNIVNRKYKLKIKNNVDVIWIDSNIL